MAPESHLCELCRQPLVVGQDGRLHPGCEEAAAAHWDAVIGMLRVRHGRNFSVLVEGDASSWTVAPAGSDDTDPEEEGFLPDACLCGKDTDGRCPSCIEIIVQYVKGLASLQQEFIERQAKLKSVGDVCDACSKEYADYSLAKMAREVFGPATLDLGRGGGSALRGLVDILKKQIGKGVRRWPLLDKAVREMLESTPEEGNNDAAF